MVTLRGRVESAADRDEAVKIARNTDGVVRVEDQLRIGDDTVATTGAKEGEGEAPVQPDAWITAKIQSKYFLDDEVKGRPLYVVESRRNIEVAAPPAAAPPRSERAPAP